MWLFTPFGFYSAVRSAEGLLQIRARVAGDLENLRTEFAPTLGPTIKTPHADYQYRALISQDDMAQAVTRFIMGIDYNNFKSAVSKKQGHARHDLYLKVWEIMYNAEHFLNQKPSTTKFWEPSPEMERSSLPAAKNLPVFKRSRRKKA